MRHRLQRLSLSAYPSSVPCFGVLNHPAPTTKAIAAAIEDTIRVRRPFLAGKIKSTYPEGGLARDSPAI
jgi:hypothetical protein